MRYVEVDPTAIVPNPWNVNVVTHENEEKLKNSIARLGMFKPVLVRELDDGTLQSLGGQHRVEQAVELGMANVPTINLGRISDERAREISLIDNARYGVDDTMRLAELLNSLDSSEIADIMPWSDEDIASIVDSLAVDVDDLDLDADADIDTDPDADASQTRPAKTHEILRFKCTLNDAARVRERVLDVIRSQGFNTSDDLSNAGDALVHILGADDD